MSSVMHWTQEYKHGHVGDGFANQTRSCSACRKNHAACFSSKYLASRHLSLRQVIIEMETNRYECLPLVIPRQGLDASKGDLRNSLYGVECLKRSAVISRYGQSLRRPQAISPSASCNLEHSPFTSWPAEDDTRSSDPRNSSTESATNCRIRQNVVRRISKFALKSLLITTATTSRATGLRHHTCSYDFNISSLWSIGLFRR